MSQRSLGHVLAFIFWEAFCRMLDAMPPSYIYCEITPSPTQHIRGNLSKCGEEPRNLDGLCLGSTVPAFA